MQGFRMMMMEQNDCMINMPARLTVKLFAFVGR